MRQDRSAGHWRTTAVAILILLAGSETTAAETILERVLSRVPRVSGLFLNVAEAGMPDTRGPGPRIDGSVTTRLTGLGLSGESGAMAGAVPMFNVNHASTTVFSAINAGDTIIGISADVSFGVPPADSGEVTVQGQGGIGLPTALAAMGANAAANGARAGRNAAAGALRLSTPGSNAAAPVVVANLAASISDVTAAVLTDVSDTSALVGDITTTAGGVINSGTVAAGLLNMKEDIEGKITGGD